MVAVVDEVVRVVRVLIVRWTISRTIQSPGSLSVATTISLVRRQISVAATLANKKTKTKKTKTKSSASSNFVGFLQARTVRRSGTSKKRPQWTLISRVVGSATAMLSRRKMRVIKL